MSRGFLSGVLMGGIVGSVGLAVASQMARPPGTTWPAAEAEPARVAAEVSSSDRAAGADAVRKTDPALVPKAPTAEPVPAGPATDLVPPAGSEFARPLPDAPPVLPTADRAPPRSEVLPVAVPDVPDSSSPDTRTASRPQSVPLEPAVPVAPADEAAAPARPASSLAAPVRLEGTAQPGVPSAEADPAAAELPPPPPLTPEEEAMLADAAGITDPARPRMIEADPPRTPADGSRLPRIGDPDPATSATAEPETDPPPIRRYARPFENPMQKPLFAVLLRDTGGPGLDREALAGLPFPVTFVIDPQEPGAATAAAMYRAAGHEVLMLATGLPEGATAADAEVMLESAALAVPEAVGMIDLPSGGFQEARTLATQVVGILESQGRGLVTHDRGLNAADQVARRQSLPAAVVFRSLDAEGANAAEIRRVLDRAAFKAAQDGRVAVYGDTRPETLQGLLEWTVEGRADAVALAPVTALMR
ncbi:polysaccharide deacteylase family 2 protein [Cereibacter sediminicola]|uniref:polysaccharide deacteylase family 2 protein n=1 Tax=Cereibacter sediminicola TaxID=2584941 RepID=UPI0011A357B1|nr:polysaccharide deacteylase family 2 protein [Cereibacter sediminicola]